MAKGTTTTRSNPQEFRRYRIALTGIYFTAFGLGASLLIASVSYELFFRRGERAPTPTPTDLVECNRDVRLLLEDLGRTAAQLQAELVAGDLGARWEDFGREWQDRWKAVGARCQFDTLADTGLGPAYDRMAWVHRALPTLRVKYREMMKRFSDDIAEEVAAMRQALGKSESLLRKQTGGPKPSTQQGTSP